MKYEDIVQEPIITIFLDSGYSFMGKPLEVGEEFVLIDDCQKGKTMIMKGAISNIILGAGVKNGNKKSIRDY